MKFLELVVAWLTSPTHWVGSDGIPTRIGEHLVLAGLATLVALLVALPVGLAFGHTGRGGFLAINVVSLRGNEPSKEMPAWSDESRTPRGRTVLEEKT